MSACASLSDAVLALSRGDAVIFPTDTVYGLGVAVEAAEGPDVLYRLKERDRGKPIAWLVASPADLDRYGFDVPALARLLAARFWPGPLTLIVHAGDKVPEAFRSNANTIGLRMPASTTALELIKQVGCPLATTSANISGHPSPRSFASIDPTLAARVDVVLGDEGDDDKSGIASTVVDCTASPLRIVREGAVMADDIAALARELS
ncbi:L-threonylcarbamoyladenylate synthase [Eggerthella sp. YY7918]|uniref:L-threonylcarbamoyladenylate synthase n=1 Tax=Eggerthella sp. (strain YY7918) TaxID=502558 RepID=UPI0002171172|nr:L-threonylcarbamoyladenylate synthase [Eggerthella sp. YY7918]BAK45202.1 hypothetical protein EGYY_21120 [Eggerthella sp. YY7918]